MSNFSNDEEIFLLSLPIIEFSRPSPSTTCVVSREESVVRIYDPPVSREPQISQQQLYEMIKKVLCVDLLLPYLRWASGALELDGIG